MKSEDITAGYFDGCICPRSTGLVPFVSQTGNRHERTNCMRTNIIIKEYNGEKIPQCQKSFKVNYQNHRKRQARNLLHTNT
jgi:hypothetical protein